MGKVPRLVPVHRVRNGWIADGPLSDDEWSGADLFEETVAVFFQKPETAAFRLHIDALSHNRYLLSDVRKSALTIVAACHD